MRNKGQFKIIIFLLIYIKVKLTFQEVNLFYCVKELYNNYLLYSYLLLFCCKKLLGEQEIY